MSYNSLTTQPVAYSLYEVLCVHVYTLLWIKVCMLKLVSIHLCLKNSCLSIKSNFTPNSLSTRSILTLVLYLCFVSFYQILIFSFRTSHIRNSLLPNFTFISFLNFLYAYSTKQFLSLIFWSATYWIVSSNFRLCGPRPYAQQNYGVV